MAVMAANNITKPVRYTYAGDVATLNNILVIMPQEAFLSPSIIPILLTTRFPVILKVRE
jgi:hypothetical protein